MQNIIDYVETTFSSFEEAPFSPVDSLVLSQFSYIRFSALLSPLSSERKTLRIRELLQSEHFQDMFYGVRDIESNKRLLFALAASPRYRTIEVGYYVDEFECKQEKQFAAMTFFFAENQAYIAFRGTDATFIGWKEDFNMAFISPVPAQEEALSYLEMVGNHYTGRLLVGGHSKGGNLAVYASINAPSELQDRIQQVFSHDGPGFKDKVFDSEGFKRMSAKIHRTLPQSSLIGMLMENQGSYQVVASNRFGLMQHDPFSWKIEHGEFCILSHISASAQFADRTLNDWLENCSIEKRETFIDSLFYVISSTEATTFSEFNADWKKNLPAMVSRAKSLDPETRTEVLKILKTLANVALKNLSHPARTPKA